MPSFVDERVTVPNLCRGGNVNWWDCQAWVLRENEHLLNAIRDTRSAIATVLGSAQNHCKNIEVTINWSMRLDGCFYVLDVDPSRREDEYKVGFTTNLDQRIATYKTIAPNVEYVISWPTRKSWEGTAIDCILRNVTGCYRIGDERSEVVHCLDLAAMVVKLNEFFMLMASATPGAVLIDPGTLADPLMNAFVEELIFPCSSPDVEQPSV